ncbi:MAG: glycosyltransferase [Bacteroidetes bacterium]|nr:glycosyltransferase [Bacteroidota bacterium]
MKLSVIIVNYNVEYFLEQCLYSVRKALHGMDAEVIVVDNNSVDGSVKMVQSKFPDVRLIANKENTGFSKANNQAIRISKGESILLLNPDTIVESDTFSKVIAFMDEHPDAGGLGVKMIDGKGRFLPESKRGLPVPSVAFFKISGLSALFPKSRIFGRYHLGYLDKEKVHTVDILSGAFMLLRKQTLDQTGLLDESFFMYGEDIDLSYRIIQAGYKNYYFPHTRIIHYKGESTKKSSLNYIFMFYQAMIVFARKHFSKKNARLVSMLIHLAIYLRAFVAILRRFFDRLYLPLLDGILIFAGIFFIKSYWERILIFPEGGHYPLTFITVAVPAYVLIWLISVYLSGGYDKPVRLIKVVQGIFTGTIIILVLYGLLSESYRFSRALIIFGAAWGLVIMLGVRLLLNLLHLGGLRMGAQDNRRFLIVGQEEEANRVAGLMTRTSLSPGFIGLVSTPDHSAGTNGFIGTLDQIRDIILIYKIDEIIFCAKDVAAHNIIDKMSELQDLQVDYKIAPPESYSIIGSNSINTAEDVFVINTNPITRISNRRNKRFLDVTISLLFLPCYPILFFLVRKPIGLLQNIFSVVFGKRSWVGYSRTEDINLHNLPMIHPGVLTPADALPSSLLTPDTVQRLNILYARDYRFVNDLNILIKGYAHLGRRH